ncbi:hypothetical protein RRG08_044290 [Elysia crispata]|uniref:Uncharacterized protein n=1 Tax=Elysia crispata TaxID=231223 RepID=A0AAE1CNU5_9GAST|nr:hypothetical protein RRG08_044290 [Elysia crispata]
MEVVHGCTNIGGDFERNRWGGEGNSYQSDRKYTAPHTLTISDVCREGTCNINRPQNSDEKRAPMGNRMRNEPVRTWRAWKSRREGVITALTRCGRRLLNYLGVLNQGLGRIMSPAAAQ